MNPKLAIAIGAVAVGVGYLWFRNRQATAATGVSACETACMVAMASQGIPPNASLCKSGCAIRDLIIGGAKRAGQKAVNTVGNAYVSVTGQSKGVCGTCCPEGTKPDFTAKLIGDGTRSGDSIIDHRGDGETNQRGSTWGAVCRDANGTIIGTLPMGGGFEPWELKPVDPPPGETSSSSSSAVACEGAAPPAGMTWEPIGGFWRRLNAGETPNPGPCADRVITNDKINTSTLPSLTAL